MNAFRHKSVIKVRQSVRYRKTQEQYVFLYYRRKERSLDFRNTFMLPTATSHRTGSTDPSSTTITSTPRLQTEVPNTATTQCDCDTDIEHWCIQTEAVATRLQDLMGQKLPREYLEHVYASYTFNHRKDDIRDKITAISKLQRKVDQCHGNILQLAGVGAELQRADNIAKQVRKLVSWLEEILVWAMHDPRILVAMHHQRELLFQTPT